MTLHIVLPTAEPNSLVWVTDTLASLGFHGTASMEKITFLENRCVACSSWGNRALILRDEFVRHIRNSSIDLSNSDAVLECLRSFSVQALVTLGIQPSASSRENPGLILTTFIGGCPRIYHSIVSVPPVAFEVSSLTCVGDEESPARIFVDYYYGKSEKSFEETLFLGIHSMRLAHQNKAAFIGEPNAWIYQAGIFKRLTTMELTRFVEMSKSLDALIPAYAKSSVIVHTVPAASAGGAPL